MMQFLHDNWGWIVGLVVVALIIWFASTADV
jgi:hypothetical protein